LGPEHVRAYQLHRIRERRASWDTVNQVVCALRFLYRTTLGRPDVVTMVPYGKRAKILPVVLSPEEVAAVIGARSDPMHRLCTRAPYGCGLRVGEVVRLRIEDIDSARMMLNVRQAKGARTGASRYPRDCSRGSAPTGACIGPPPGCSPERVPPTTSTRPPYKTPSRARFDGRGGASGRGCTRCGTASRRTFGRPAPTC
jgi:hypothetical protein